MVPAVNIVNIYGQQECRTAKEQIFKSWARLGKDLDEIDMRGEAVLIIGDMNRAVGSDEFGVTGNHARVSYGGGLIRDTVKDRNYAILNNLISGDPWTWVQRGKSSIKSCLDLAIASTNLLPFVKRIEIIKDEKFIPRRVVWRKGRFSSVYTDHFPLEIELSGMPRRRNNVVKSCSWNVGKPGGWEVYEKLSDKAAESILAIVENEYVSIEQSMKKIDAIDN